MRWGGVHIHSSLLTGSPQYHLKFYNKENTKFEPCQMFNQRICLVLNDASKQNIYKVNLF